MHCLLELVTKAISLFVTWMEDAIQGPHCYLGSKVTYVGQRTNVDITFNLLLCHFLALILILIALTAKLGEGFHHVTSTLKCVNQ